jgi:acyl-CoA synthetase (AMP-forming)/AMP-acid ligase II
MMSLSARLAALPKRLHHIIATHPHAAPALYEHGEVMTFAMLRDAVEELAKTLRDEGVRAGDRVMLVAENSRLLVAAILAASQLDAWAVIINARLSAGEIETIRQHCAARRVLFSSAVSTDAAAHAERAGAQIRQSALLGSYHLGPLNEACAPEPVHADPAMQVAAMIYTTGTTGDPKGVMLTHRNLMFVADTARTMRKLTEADSVFAVLPFSHVFGLSSVCLASLYAGCSQHLEARFDPAKMIRALANDNISMMLGVPAMFAKALELADTQHIELRAPTLRFMYAGGSPLDQTLKDTVEQRFGCRLHNGYGLTESSPTISHTRVDQPRRDTSVGPPIDGVEVRLLNSQRTAPVAPGEVGELWVRGPNVMKGYYRAEQQTAAVIDAEGWFNTGDLARADADGALFIVGRSKELIIRSGFNVYPPEVEAALNAYPGVVMSAVVGRAVDGNEEVVAFIQVLAPETFDLAALQAFLAEQLAPYKRPAELRILSSLPAAASGKVLKHQLQKMAMHA